MSARTVEARFAPDLPFRVTFEPSVLKLASPCTD
jgi:hypothetical protein